jgi:DNA invertase Pin-like site-specific DNA recombinase
MAKIGYARVSTAEQNLDRQEDALQTLNLDRLFSDKLSGMRSPPEKSHRSVLSEPAFR